MPFPSTSLDGWWTKTKSGFRGIVGAVVDIWPNTYAVIAKVLALLAREFDLRLAILYRQIFVSDADAAFVRRHAFEYGIIERAAGRAIGSIAVTAAGSGTFPAGLSFTRSDGALFLTTASAIAVPGSVTLLVQADLSGLAGNTVAGDVFTLLSDSPVVITGGTGTVTAGGLSGGTAPETVEELRARVLDRRRNPPQGGSATDWTKWAKEVPGVVRVWVDSFSNTDRRVWIAITFKDRVNGIPDVGDVAVVQAYLSDVIRRPVTARVTVVAPVAVAVAVTATGVEPLTVAVIAAVKTELAAVFAERMDMATPNRTFTLPRVWISEAISRATGETRHTLTAPATDVTYSTSGQLPVLGTVILS